MIGLSTAIILDKRFLRKDNTYAVKLRVTYFREQKYYPLNISLTDADWEKVHSSKPRKKHKEYLLYFSEIENKALEIIKDMTVFSFPAFEKKFNQKPKHEVDTISLFESYIEQLKKENRIGTADSYTWALTSIKKFTATRHRKKLHFAEVTPELLSEYEQWMIELGNSPTTIGIYLRSLRTIINNAIASGLLDKESYPFGKRKYQTPSGRNIKKALKTSDISKIISFQTTSRFQERARDLWLFSYLCNGANMKDIARLKYKNIDGDKIHFIRSKTERSTKQELKPISVFLLPESMAIIEKWGNKNHDPENYIFGIIDDSDTPEKVHARVKQTVRRINEHMKKIGTILGFDIKLTTYSARHSYATVLKRSGAPIEFISESLGHKDLKTTENYLDSFEDEMKESFQKQLLNFSKTTN
jgi:integrase/recombinase XerD